MRSIYMDAPETRGYDDVVRIAEEVQEERGPGTAQKWAESPFAWIKLLASGTIGAVGQEIMMRFLEDYGISARKAAGPGGKWHVDGLLAQVKCSTLWSDGAYKFQQFRVEPWDVAVCFGLSPNNAHCWVIPREEMELEVMQRKGQHTGEDATETFWFRVDPAAPEDWLAPYGGDPHSAAQLLREMIGS